MFADHANNTLTRRIAKRFNVYNLDIPTGMDPDSDLGDSVFTAVVAAIALAGVATWDEFATALAEELEKLDNGGVEDTIPTPESLEKLFN